MGRWVMALAVLAAAAQPVAPRFKAGLLPALPGPTVGGGEVLLEVALDRTGKVVGVRTLRDTPPYTEALRAAVKDWLFEPARDAAGKPAPSTVLVGGSFRPATTMGPAPGQLPRDLASPAPGMPFPAKAPPALYPPLARGDAQVIVEMTVAPDGTPTVRVVRSAPGFDDAGLQSARDWRFRPTPGGGRAYIVYGFRQAPGT